ncbi:helix-turn-helix domain-containing protein [Candidatus Poriferisodalis sp.]|uniref:helix-turn-helix domain-containing protein n=1 Tax=Candidatus Poriferisodalis sp. TaxID=3101277 RepID=UPI003B02A8D8
MATIRSNRDSFDAINREVGARLAQRRSELGRSLRQIAGDAEVSTSHLSDIESGACRVSLPVLLRIVRALDLTITELLPQIGGHRVRRMSISEMPDNETRSLSHDDLDLSVSLVRLNDHQFHKIENPERADVLMYVLNGTVACDADGTVVLLEQGDTLDTEQVACHRLEASADAQVLVASSKPNR